MATREPQRRHVNTPIACISPTPREGGRGCASIPPQSRLDPGPVHTGPAVALSEEKLAVPPVPECGNLGVYLLRYVEGMTPVEQKVPGIKSGVLYQFDFPLAHIRKDETMIFEHKNG